MDQQPVIIFSEKDKERARELAAISLIRKLCEQGHISERVLMSIQKDYKISN